MQNILADFAEPMASVPMTTAVFRLALALVLGAAIGWEREMHTRAAGLRTHMMIALAAAIFTLIAKELTYFEGRDGAPLTFDPLRLIEAVTSGVAFLAAGSIFVSGASVRGVTTGASMWLVGAIGLCCGTGDVQLAILATALALIVLWLIRQIVPVTDKNEANQKTAE